MLEPRSPAIAAVALPTELPLHNSGMRQITATHQPYDTIPNRPEGGIGWISAMYDLLTYLLTYYLFTYLLIYDLITTCL